MAGSQGLGDLFTRAFEWLSDRVSATFTWLTQDRASIREELTQRTAELQRSGVYGAIGRSAISHGLNIAGDLLRDGNVSSETRAQIDQQTRERISRLPTADQTVLREVKRLQTAGGFSEAEMNEISEQAKNRNSQQRGR